jgi:hypothetical protein
MIRRADPGTIRGVSGFWAIFWLAVVMKIPIGLLLWIVWWAIKDPPLPEAGPGPGGGSDREPRPHPRDWPPRPPRRGPHAKPSPGSPQRVRVARARRLRPQPLR